MFFSKGGPPGFKGGKDWGFDKGGGFFEKGPDFGFDGKGMGDGWKGGCPTKGGKGTPMHCPGSPGGLSSASSFTNRHGPNSFMVGNYKVEIQRRLCLPLP